MIKLFHYFSFREHQLSKFNAFNLDFHEEDMGKDCYK